MMYRLSRGRHADADPVAAAWIFCLLLAVLALAWSGVV